MIIHQLGVVQVHRTFANLLDHFIAEKTRLVEFFVTCSVQFELADASLNTSVVWMRVEQETYALLQCTSNESNLRSRNTVLQGKSSGWFDFTEPHPNTSLNALAHHSSGSFILSKPLERHYCMDSKVCRVLKHKFGVVQHYRTFTRHSFKGEARCAA